MIIHLQLALFTLISLVDNHFECSICTKWSSDSAMFLKVSQTIHYYWGVGMLVRQREISIKLDPGGNKWRSNCLTRQDRSFGRDRLPVGKESWQFQ